MGDIIEDFRRDWKTLGGIIEDGDFRRDWKTLGLPLEHPL